jgi:hypothetical protein
MFQKKVLTSAICSDGLDVGNVTLAVYGYPTWNA